MNCGPLFDAHRRKPRSQHILDCSPGLYALFLNVEGSLPGFVPPPNGLIYIGKADGIGGLKRRCHFNGGTRNHSPRKSLAAILREELGLRPVPILTRSGTFKTWALNPSSEHALNKWMHANLELSIFELPEPRVIEARLIAEHAPILNLTNCSQSSQHRQISEMRAEIERAMRFTVDI